MSPTEYLPMTTTTLETDPGLFFPKVMMGVRDINVFPLQGEYKRTGNIAGPLFPTNGVLPLVASIGADATPGKGVTGTTSGAGTTLSTASTAGATTVSTVATEAVGTILQIDTNTGTTTTAECRKVTAVTGAGPYTLTLDQALTYPHASGVAAQPVVAPFTHSVAQANALPSLTVEKNIGGYQSLQFTGARVNKWDLKAAVGDNTMDYTADIITQSAVVLDTPNPVAVTDELPFVFPETSLSLFGQSLTQATTVDLSIENGLKPTYTFNGSHDLEFLTPVTRLITGTVDLVFTSLDDPTWGYYTQMLAATQAPLSLTFTHPTAPGYSVAIDLAQATLKTYKDDIKLEDVVITSLAFEAMLDLSTNTTISATVKNGRYLPY